MRWQINCSILIFLILFFYTTVGKSENIQDSSEDYYLKTDNGDLIKVQPRIITTNSRQRSRLTTRTEPNLEQILHICNPTKEEYYWAINEKSNHWFNMHVKTNKNRIRNQQSRHQIEDNTAQHACNKINLLRHFKNSTNRRRQKLRRRSKRKNDDGIRNVMRLSQDNFEVLEARVWVTQDYMASLDLGGRRGKGRKRRQRNGRK